MELNILIGLIYFTDYTRQIKPVWDMRYFMSEGAQIIARWCFDYFDSYGESPGKLIEEIYFEKKDSNNLSKDMAEETQDIIIDIFKQDTEDFNIRYYVYRTQKYIKERHLELHNDAVQMLFEDGDVDGAKALAEEYTGPVFDVVNDLDLGNELAMENMEKAFIKKAIPLITYPGALGKMMNDQLVRGGFVALMASEKRGKSFWLLDMSIRASRNGNKVAFFQAGDMTEDQQLMRISSYMSKLPTNKKYLGRLLVPKADCIRNQLGTCDKEEHRGDLGIFTETKFDEDNFRRDITREEYDEAFLDYGDDHKICTNCSDFHEQKIGTPWYTQMDITHVVTLEEAQRKLQKFFVNRKRSFRISTHANNTLTVGTIKSILDRWKRLYSFIPDVIIVDYADLLVAISTREFRHAQNEIWKDLRSLSQERDCLVITATQADAKSYDKDLLRMQNFSEDKRKYAHVTAMYGLNQDQYGREKKLGIMRINELVKREGEFDGTSTVTVLQSLNLGRPYIDSFI